MQTCLHAHEDAPSTVRGRINEAGEEAADEQWKPGIVNVDVLRQPQAGSVPTTLPLVSQQRRMFIVAVLHRTRSPASTTSVGTRLAIFSDVVCAENVAR